MIRAGSSCCPAVSETLSYMNEVIERCIGRLERSERLSADEFYFYWLTSFHEAMHAEALAYTRQTLGYPAPVVQGGRAVAVDGGARSGDVEIPGGKYLIGATKDFRFVFDNEKWAHEVMLKPFRIARAPVTNGEFLEFVEAGGYRERGILERRGLAVARIRRLARSWKNPSPSSSSAG